jgi:aryl-alcohol dehydrogenase-like predicted oxidoreductase
MFVVHGPDPSTPLEETLGVLEDLVHQGKIHYVGASNFEAWRLTRALWISDKHDLVRFDWVQSSYSLLDRTPEKEVLPLCEDQSLGFTPYSPLGGGWLTGKYRAGQAYPEGSRMSLRPEPYSHLVQEKTFRAVARFCDCAKARGVDPTTLAIAWVLTHPRTTAVILGPRKPAHLEAGQRAVALSLTATERNELAQLFNPTSVP